MIKINGNFLTTVRTLLAISSLTILVFTPLEGLFPAFHMEKVTEGASWIESMNIFLWFRNIYIPYWLSIIVLGLVMIGIMPRITSVLHTLVSYSIFYSLLIVEGGDQINAILTFLLLPVCLCDNRINGWKNQDIIIENKYLAYFIYINMYIIMVQMALLYLNAGIAKLFQNEWNNGTAVYYWFNESLFGAPEWMATLFGWLFTNNFTVALINYGVILLELFLFIGLFLKRKVKYRLFIFGFVFHFLIWIVHGLPSFWISMTAGLVLYLLDYKISIKDNLILCKKAFSSIFKYDNFQRTFESK